MAKVFCGLRDLLTAAAESEFGIEPDGVGRAVTPPLDGISAGAHPAARGIAQAPRGDVCIARKQQDVVLPLMIALSMVMLEDGRHRGKTNIALRSVSRWPQC